MAINLQIGEYSRLVEGVTIAPITGSDVDRACGVLALRPPFRDTEEARELGLDEEADNEARDLAENAAGCSRIVEAIYPLDEAIDSVVFSKNGALAVKGTLDHPDDESVFALIELLDGGNAIAIHDL